MTSDQNGGSTRKPRKTAPHKHRKGLLAGSNPYQMIEDEEYLLNQTASKQKFVNSTLDAPS